MCVWGGGDINTAAQFDASFSCFNLLQVFVQTCLNNVWQNGGFYQTWFGAHDNYSETLTSTVLLVFQFIFYSLKCNVNYKQKPLPAALLQYGMQFNFKCLKIIGSKLYPMFVQFKIKVAFLYFIIIHLATYIILGYFLVGDVFIVKI